MVVITPGLAWTFMQEVPKLIETMDPNGTTTVGKNAKVLNSVFETANTLTETFKSPNIGDVTNDTNSQDIFNAFNNDLKIGGISGIDHEKLGINFDNIPGMKAFSTDIKNSDSIFSFNESLKIGDISGIDYGKNNFDKFPNYFN